MYRILTEDKNRDLVHAILREHVKGYTITEAIGSWEGVQEKSIAIDLVGPDLALVEDIAGHIKRWNGQESVLILDLPVTATFV